MHLYAQLWKGRLELELSRSKIEARLLREGWLNVGGAKHDKFKQAGNRQAIILPRHRTISPGVAKTIAAAAGWL